MRGYVPGRISSPTIADEQSAAMTRIILGFAQAKDAILEHLLMQDVEIPDSEIADVLAEMSP